MPIENNENNVEDENMEDDNDQAIRMKEYLKDIYYNPRISAGFSGPKKIYDYIKAQGVMRVTLSQIVKFLKSEQVYTTHFPFKKSKFNTPVVTPRPRYQYDIDSGYLPSKNKRANKYFILAIDTFTRKISARSVKDLKANSAVTALREIFRDLGLSERIRSDKGKEYLNKQVKNFLKSQNVKHYIGLNPNKANYAERAMRTIKSGLYKTMQRQGRPNWTQNMLDDTVYRYNNSKHRSINRTPNSILNQTDELEVWEYLIKQKMRAAPNPKSYKFELNDAVRIAYMRDPFTKDYAEKFSGEVYFITSSFSPFNTNRYTLKDANNEPIEGSFLEAELQSVKVDENTEYRVEQVLEKKVVNGVPHVLIKWLDYNKNFNSWIPLSELKKINSDSK